MDIFFSKYHGTGNDFILIDDRDLSFPIGNQEFIKNLCHRQYGIGGDGLILLHPSHKGDFSMRIFNANGNEAQMCGNGLRCLVDFLKQQQLIHKKVSIETQGGLYSCFYDKTGILVEMGVPQEVEKKVPILIDGVSYSCFYLHVGVPHVVVFTQEGIDGEDFISKARAIRYHPHFSPVGVNVNFANVKKGEVQMRTYERGVEGETFSCGTGATAVAFAAWKMFQTPSPIKVRFITSNQSLYFQFQLEKEALIKIQMRGEVTPVFSGKINKGEISS